MEKLESSSFLESFEALSRSIISSKSEKTHQPMQTSSRLYATRTFITDHGVQPEDDALILPNVNSMLVLEQEKALTKDLLYLLSGAEACLISIHPISHNKIGFTVDERIDPSLKDLTLQITQVAGYYYTVQKYIEKAFSFDYGKVNHALAAAMKTLLREYHILIGQLETMLTKDELSLQNLWFYIHQSIQQLSIMSSIATSIEDKAARGGHVLSILHEKAISMAGDQSGKKVCYTLVETASQPYFVILENWIYKGMIHDPFDEFFISEGDSAGSRHSDDGEFVATDDYWDKRYNSDNLACPTFLRKMSNEILKAGKYLNVIRQCGQEIGLYMGGKIEYSIHEHFYVDSIQSAFAFASKTLLDLLLNDYDLMKRIESVKHYLLMDQGDFIVQFLDLTEEELCKRIDDLNESRLTSLLELALRTSSSCTDPYKECVKVELFPRGIRDMLLNMITIGTPFEKETFDLCDTFSIPGVEAFSLKFEVKWPVSLVLNDRAVTNYQLIFRHLFFCKHVERRLCQVWIDGKKHKKLQLKDQAEKSAAFALKQKMLNFVQNLLYYMAFEVIEPAWLNFLTTMSKVQNIDQVMESHTSFLSSIVHDSMLTTSDLLDKITTLLSYCLQFSNKFLDKCQPPPSTKCTSRRKSPCPSFKHTTEFDKSFSDLLVHFLRDVSNMVQSPNQSSKVINIIHRMNFNGFYSKALLDQER